MTDPIPLNDLDRAIVAMLRSRSAVPELLRRLREGDLWMLVPFHPEVANEEMNYLEGEPLPFLRTQSKDGVMVAVYSSQARALEGLKKAGMKPNAYMPAIMSALDVLGMLGKLELKMSLNQGCATGAVLLPPKSLRDLAAGTALKPSGADGESEQLRLDKVDPADYPTDLLQPVFEFFRRHEQFRVAWIFSRTMPGQPAPLHKPCYLLVLMEPRDGALFHDFLLVAKSEPRAYEVNISLTESNEPELIANLFRQAQPFYVAAGYQPPV